MQAPDFWRLSGFLLAGLVIGALTSATGWCLFFATLIYALTVQSDLNRLLAWVRQHKKNEPPEQAGVFEELTLEIDYLRERHKKRKKKLGSYLKQFQQATRALPDATVILDANDEVRWANDAAKRDLRIRWPEDVGQRVTNLVREPRMRKYIEAKFESGDHTIEIENPADPERQLSVLVVPYGNNQRILVARDVTQLHRANQIRGDFVANVSHELRTPLTVFRGYLETISNQQELAPEAWRSAVEQMTVHAERMGSLVEQLLLLSSLEAEVCVPQPEIVRVADLCAEIHSRASELPDGKDRLFSLEIDGDLAVMGSRAELYDALSNLVFNAVHYTKAKGVIKIRWFRDEQDAVFEVEDDGIGISAEHIPRLTERFYRVESSRHRADSTSGSGLGLSIAKHALARHSAQLSITSEPGAGSTFTVRFPESQICQTDSAEWNQRDAG